MEQTWLETPAAKAFTRDLVEEHLDEACFLYDQCQFLRSDPHRPWQDVKGFEERLDPHLDALAEDPATFDDLVAEAEPEPSVLYAQVSVLCRQQRPDKLGELLGRLTPDDPEKLSAVTLALKHELPEGWQDHLPGWMAEEVQGKVLGFVHGHRRWPMPEKLVVRFREEPATLWYIGRMKATKWESFLQQGLAADDPNTRQISAIALLRLGNRDVLSHCRALLPKEPWASLVIAINGALGDLQDLVQSIQKNPTKEALLALGLLGHTDAIPVLIEALSIPDLAPQAALSLELITGANLTEKVFVQDEPEDGEPQTTGIQQERLTQNPEAWKTWWTQNKHNFSRSHCHRAGQPLNPDIARAYFESPTTPQGPRQWALEEYAIRHRLELPIANDMPVGLQVDALAQGRGHSRNV